MNVVIYSRVSSQSTRQSTERQVVDLERFATGRGDKVVAVFEEKVSGRKANVDRPVLSRCLEYCIDSQNQVDMLLLAEISRLGRSTLEILKALDILHTHKVCVYIQKLKQIIDDYKYEIGIAKERGTEPNIKIEESGIQQENGHKQVNTRIDYSNKPQDKYNIEALSNKEVIGTISYYDFNGKVCEVIEYNTVESYLKSIKDELNSNPNGFKYETLTTDANIRKSVDDIVYGAYGEDNPHPLEWYSSNNTKAAISPEQYLSEERNKIMREYAKNPFGALDKENISAEGMDKWAAVTNKYMEMKTNISTKQIELQSSGCKTLIYDVFYSSGQKESSHYRILDKSTGKTESINVGDIDLEKQSPETLKKLLSGQQTEMTNKSGTNSLVTLNKTITGWGISAVKQVFNSADNSAGI